MKHLISVIFLVLSIVSGNAIAACHPDDDDCADNYVGGKKSAVGADFFDKQKIPLKSQVMTGNYANIKSCNDIAEVKIPSSEIGSRPYGLSVTRNNETIKPQPQGQLFSDVTEIIGVNGNEIYTRTTNLGGSREWGYSLNTVKTTKWLRDNVSVGRPIYFVAKYVGNSNLNLGSGPSKRVMPIREAELVCADILYNK